MRKEHKIMSGTKQNEDRKMNILRKERFGELSRYHKDLWRKKSQQKKSGNERAKVTWSFFRGETGKHNEKEPLTT